MDIFFLIHKNGRVQSVLQLQILENICKCFVKMREKIVICVKFFIFDILRQVFSQNAILDIHCRTFRNILAYCIHKQSILYTSQYVQICSHIQLLIVAIFINFRISSKLSIYLQKIVSLFHHVPSTEFFFISTLNHPDVQLHIVNRDEFKHVILTPNLC